MAAREKESGRVWIQQRSWMPDLEWRKRRGDLWRMSRRAMRP